MNSAAITSIKVKKTNFRQATNKVLFIKLSTIFAVTLLLFFGGWKIKSDTKGKILPKVTVAGVNIGGRTPIEAKRLLLNYIDTLNKKGPTIYYEDQTIGSTLPELGVTFDVDKVVDQAYNLGREGSLKNKIVQNYKIIFQKNDVPLNPIVDENKLDEFLAKINKQIDKPAQNASLEVNNGQISVIAEKQGIGFNRDKLKNDISFAINNETDAKIALEISVLQPKIFAKNTVDAQKQAEALMQSGPINLIYQNRVYIISKEDIGSWIVFNENDDKLNAGISDQKVSDFAYTIASKIEIKKIDREVMDGTGEVLVEGQDGIGVDTGRLAQEILARIEVTSNGAIAIGTYPIAKAEIIKNPHAQPGRYPGKYIDVNLSEQTLYAFEGNNLVNQFLISSGISSHPTPTGEFSVYAKTRSQTMDGPGYSLPNVEWISWWSGDYSIHGTYWHHNFGHPMSHGCVNASNNDAEWIYNWDDIGTPVYIHW